MEEIVIPTAKRKKFSTTILDAEKFKFKFKFIYSHLFN